MTRRFKLTLEYNGTPFHGWQRQADQISVQQVLEEAIYKFCKQTVNAFVAGRTDAGVHARAQVCHIDLETTLTPFRIQEAINHFLKRYPIVILDLEEVDQNFHARFSAMYRAYEYVIFNRRAKPTLNADTVWHVRRELDEKAMHNAAQTLIGTHDFSSFRATECQAKSPVKSLDQFDIKRQGQYITAKIKARSFLHHQVRNMIGSLQMVGLGQYDQQDIMRILEAKDRCAAGVMAPASGLFLMEVGY